MIHCCLWAISSWIVPSGHNSNFVLKSGVGVRGHSVLGVCWSLWLNCVCVCVCHFLHISAFFRCKDIFFNSPVVPREWHSYGLTLHIDHLFIMLICGHDAPLPIMMPHYHTECAGLPFSFSYCLCVGLKAPTYQTDSKEEAVTKIGCCVCFVCKVGLFTWRGQQLATSRRHAAPAPRQIPLHRYTNCSYD